MISGPSQREVDLIVDDIKLRDGTAIGEAMDLSQGNLLVEETLNEFDRVDGVVVCVQPVDSTHLSQLSPTEAESILDAELCGHFVLLKEAWNTFYSSRFGRIVFVVNSTGFHGGVGKTMEGAVSGAFCNTAQVMGMEGYRYDIKANTIAVPPSTGKSSRDPSTAAVAYLCHESCPATAGIFQVDSDGDMKQLRIQSDEDFVDFDPTAREACLDDVAEKWFESPRFATVAYQCVGSHLSYR
jgi:NAD(P)-dependent dehydrogenase (short-subunit alcohol dehydrogenase family)